MTSYYDLLGVDVDAGFEEVRRAYHRKAQLLHPDRHPGSSDAERRQAETAMVALNEAWNTLRTGRWSGAAIADLRWRALNAGMTAPQATCFVEAVTSRYGPSDEVPVAAVQQLANACR